jgi:RNA polymerase sigma-70 factor (ECF subfamily)
MKARVISDMLGFPAVAMEVVMDTAPLSAVETRLRTALKAGLAGDARCYRDFLEELGACLRSYLRRRLQQAPADVEDVLQETLLAIHNGRHTWDPSQPLTPWLYAIARYRLIDHARSRRRREDMNLPLEDAGELLAAADHEPAQAGHDLGRLLQQLPDRHRLPIQLVKVEGLSVREAAIRTGMSESAIKVGVHRGLKALAGLIRDTP